MYLGMRAGPAHEQAGPASCGPDSRAHSRKRKSSVPADSYLKSPRGSYSHSALESTGSEDYDDDTGDDKSVRTTDENKKQNHSEIEKRRRDKMNTYIQELSGMVPLCAAMARKLDKLTVLRLAVQHLKTVRGAARTLAEGALRSPFLSDADVKALVLRAADGFLFVVGCDRGRILYVSESVSRILNYSPGELLGQNWFDILHPKDVAKVKEQLSSSDLSPRERLIDAKTMLPVKADVPQGASKLCPGARRSFFCRMKCRAPAPGTTPSQGPGPPPPSQHLKEESDSASSASTPQTHRRKKHASSDKRYSVIQCSGYLKSWAGEGGPAAPSALGAGESRGGAEGGEAPDLGGGGSLSCLVAVGRPHPSSSSPPQPPPRPTATQPRCRPLYFISRHAMDGKFLFVDQRSTIVLGFLPQELLGTSMYEYFHPEDIPQLAEAHKLALLSGEKTSTPAYRMKAKEGGCVLLRSEWRAFRNPWTKELEYLIAKNCVISEDHSMPNDATVASSSSGMANTFDFLGQASGREMQKYISSHVESSKIGSQIASQVLEGQTRGDSEGNSPIQEQGFPSPLRLPMEPSSVLTMSPLGHPLGLPPNGALPSFSEVRALSPPAPSQPLLSDSMGLGGSEAEGEGDGSDEAAMAVIMSLLEADAGLGGPVDFSGLPWPLP